LGLRSRRPCRSRHARRAESRPIAGIRAPTAGGVAGRPPGCRGRRSPQRPSSPWPARPLAVSGPVLALFALTILTCVGTCWVGDEIVPDAPPPAAAPRTTTPSRPPAPTLPYPLAVKAPPTGRTPARGVAGVGDGGGGVFVRVGRSRGRVGFVVPAADARHAVDGRRRVGETAHEAALVGRADVGRAQDRAAYHALGDLRPDACPGPMTRGPMTRGPMTRVPLTRGPATWSPVTGHPGSSRARRPTPNAARPCLSGRVTRGAGVLESGRRGGGTVRR
jgi:hypothetical protein